MKTRIEQSKRMGGWMDEERGGRGSMNKQVPLVGQVERTYKINNKKKENKYLFFISAEDLYTLITLFETKSHRILHERHNHQEKIISYKHTSFLFA